MPAPSCFTCYYSTACEPAEQHPEYTNPLLCNKPVTLPEKVWPLIWPIVEASFWCVNFREKPIYPGYEWILPDDYFLGDPTIWTDPLNAFDGIVTSTATAVNVPKGEWSDFIEFLLTIPAIVDKVRFIAYGPWTTDKIDIDIYYNDDWHDVYEGTFTSRQIVEQDISDGPWTVEKARLRIYNNNPAMAQSKYLYEFHFDKVNIT